MNFDQCMNTSIGHLKNVLYISLIVKYNNHFIVLNFSTKRRQDRTSLDNNKI